MNTITLGDQYPVVGTTLAQLERGVREHGIKKFLRYGIALNVPWFISYFKEKQLSRVSVDTVTGEAERISEFIAVRAALSDLLDVPLVYANVFPKGMSCFTETGDFHPFLSLGATWEGLPIPVLSEAQMKTLREELVIGGMSVEEAMETKPDWYSPMYRERNGVLGSSAN